MQISTTFIAVASVYLLATFQASAQPVHFGDRPHPTSNLNEFYQLRSSQSQDLNNLPLSTNTHPNNPSPYVRGIQEQQFSAYNLQPGGSLGFRDNFYPVDHRPPVGYIQRPGRSEFAFDPQAAHHLDEHRPFSSPKVSEHGSPRSKDGRDSRSSSPESWKSAESSPFSIDHGKSVVDAWHVHDADNLQYHEENDPKWEHLSPSRKQSIMEQDKASQQELSK